MVAGLVLECAEVVVVVVAVAVADVVADDAAAGRFALALCEAFGAVVACVVCEVWVVPLG